MSAETQSVRSVHEIVREPVPPRRPTPAPQLRPQSPDGDRHVYAEPPLL